MEEFRVFKQSRSLLKHTSPRFSSLFTGLLVCSFLHMWSSFFVSLCRWAFYALNYCSQPISVFMWSFWFTSNRNWPLHSQYSQFPISGIEISFCPRSLPITRPVRDDQGHRVTRICTICTGSLKGHEWGCESRKHQPDRHPESCLL